LSSESDSLIPQSHHQKCISDWLKIKGTCPLCATNINPTTKIIDPLWTNLFWKFLR